MPKPPKAAKAATSPKKADRTAAKQRKIQDQVARADANGLVLDAKAHPALAAAQFKLLVDQLLCSISLPYSAVAQSQLLDCCRLLPGLQHFNSSSKMTLLTQ